jgi:hypothetical protein
MLSALFVVGLGWSGLSCVGFSGIWWLNVNLSFDSKRYPEKTCDFFQVYTVKHSSIHDRWFIYLRTNTEEIEDVGL